MLKGQKSLILLAVVLAVLIVLYMVIRMWNHQSAEKESKRTEEEKSRIAEVKMEDVTAFRYEKGESKMKFVRKDGKWFYEEDMEVPISQDAVEKAATVFSNLTVERKLKQPDEMSDYGLDKPSYSMQYIMGDGGEKKICAGDQVQDQYYVTVDDTKEVYTVAKSYFENLKFSLADFVEYDKVPEIKSGNLVKVEVTENGQKMEYTLEDELKKMADGFEPLRLNNCQNYHVKEEMLASYGLDFVERTTVTAVYTEGDDKEEKIFTIHIGKKDSSDKNRYVRAEGSKLVCTVDKELVQKLMLAGGNSKR